MEGSTEKKESVLLVIAVVDLLAAPLQRYQANVRGDQR